MWIVEKIISKGDYDYAVVLEHPCALPIGHYVLAHRVVLENYLGRLLDDGEIAHHINGDKKDNRIKNIELCLEAVHRRYHAKTGKTFITFICNNCGKEFKREKRNSPLSKGSKRTYCGRDCFYKSKKKTIKGGVVQLDEHRSSKPKVNGSSNLLIPSIFDKDILDMIEKNKPKKEIRYCFCGVSFHPNKKSQRFCSQDCYNKNNRKFEISKEELNNLVWKYPIIKVAEFLGVSDVAIAKRCKRLEVKTPKRGYWLKRKNIY